MTVAEIKEMIKNMKDDQNVIFVTYDYDRDGCQYEREECIVAIVPEGTEQVKNEFGNRVYKR